MVKRIIDREELAQLAAELRRDMQVIVATNGCFDLLHVGHKRYLEQARELGTVLVVGLNSDASVTRLKGPTRPLNNHDERAELLAAMRCVDYVSVFGEDTASEFLRILKPDIYVKGGDYTLDRVPEAAVVAEYGGKTVLMDLVPGRSTTALVNKLNG